MKLVMGDLYQGICARFVGDNSSRQVIARTSDRGTNSIDVKLTLQYAFCFLLTALALVWSEELAKAQTVPPPDAYPSCTVSHAEFDSWFLPSPSLAAANAFVSPPQYLSFPRPEQDCAFYKWAEHMFLWVTSPPPFPPGYKIGSYVFESSVFYRVSDPDINSRRTLVENTLANANQPPSASVSISQLGPRGEVVVFDQMGIMHEIALVEGGGAPVVRAARQLTATEIGRVEVGQDGFPIFLNKRNERINYERSQNGAPKLLGIDLRPIAFKVPPQTIEVGGQLYFLDASDKAIAAGPGQADSDNFVLMARNGKLIYYMIQVNDVYAYFLTGNKNHVINSIVFPTGTKELDQIKAYGRKHGHPSFPDEDALVVEVKSSWIEVPDIELNDYKNDYLVIQASVPTFDMSTSPKTTWKHNGSATVNLAMVGMHIAFSVPNRPELVWATFEHVNNAANAPYAYYDKRLKKKGGPWRLSSAGEGAENAALSIFRSDTYNVPRMRMDKMNDIVALPDHTIGPSNVLRISPWGNSSPTFNTKIISMNNRVRGLLPDGDIRKNYIMIGTTWFSEVADAQVANSTIETFQQPSNCLGCHQSMNDDMYKLGTLSGAGISHIYGPLQPLFGK